MVHHFSLVCQETVLGNVMEQWDNPETVKLCHTSGTGIYNARCLAKLLIGSLTDDAMALIQHCIDQHKSMVPP
jgi:hypothetical protein